jgi:hypothetical protein
MGASEFEWGAVPKSLDTIISYVENGDSSIGEIKIYSIPVYYICHKSQESEIKIRIKELGISPCKFRTKESVLFDEALAARLPDNIVPEKKDKYKYYFDYVGWLEMDNDFIFFIDKEVFDNFVMMLPINRIV